MARSNKSCRWAFILLAVVIGGVAASGRGLRVAGEDPYENQNSASASLNQPTGYVHSNGMWTTYQSKPPAGMEKLGKLKSLAKSDKENPNPNTKAVSGATAASSSTQDKKGGSDTRDSTHYSTVPAGRVAAGGEYSEPVLTGAKGSYTTPGGAAVPSKAGENKVLVKQTSYAASTGKKPSSPSPAPAKKEKEVKVTQDKKGTYYVNEKPVDIKMALKKTILADAQASSLASTLCSKGPMGALSLSKAIASAIFGQSSAEAQAIAYGLDKPTKAASEAISKAFSGDAEANALAKACSTDKKKAQAVSKAVAESIYGDVTANDYAVTVAGDKGTAKSKSSADSKTKNGSAGSSSGAASRAGSDGKATSDSKAVTKAKDGPADSVADSVASVEHSGKAVATAATKSKSNYETSGRSSAAAMLN